MNIEIAASQICPSTPARGKLEIDSKIELPKPNIILGISYRNIMKSDAKHCIAFDNSVTQVCFLVEYILS